MRKLLVCMGLLALFTAPAMAAVDLGLPIDTEVNFDGNGVFDQSVPGGFDALGPLPAPAGAELFGAGTITDVASLDTPGLYLWWATDEGPNFEMTFVFWDAVVAQRDASDPGRYFVNRDADATLEVLLTASYLDGARILLVQDTSKDFDSSPGPGMFDLQDGEYPTAYTLEDVGYNSDSVADATSDWTIADDANEEVFLDLSLDGNTSALWWDPDTSRFVSGEFKSTDVEILGGSGASQFSDYIGADGSAAALILTFNPSGWAFGGDIDIQLTTIPEPATLVFLGTGLAGLFGYGIRRKMS